MKQQLKKYYLILALVAGAGTLILLISILGAGYSLQHNAGIALILGLLVLAFCGFTTLITAIFSFAFLLWRLKKAARAAKQSNSRNHSK